LNLWDRNLIDDDYLLSAFLPLAQAGSVSGYPNQPEAYLAVRTERWHIEVFARNLSDEEALLTRTNSTAVMKRQPTGYANHWSIPSRRVGLSASYRW